MADKTDLRVTRTKTAIKEAFESLVLENSLDRITVKALTERVGINRKTFYLHYETIESLYDEILTEIMDAFFEQFEETPDIPEDIAGHARRFFLFMASQPIYVERMVCAPSYYEFGEKVYFEQMARYRTAGNPFKWMPDSQMQLVLRFIRATALDFYRAWVAGDKAVAKDKAAELVAEITLHGVERLMK